MVFEQRADKLEQIADAARAQIAALLKQAEKDFDKHVKRATGRGDWSFGSANNLTLSLALIALSLAGLALTFFR